MTLAAACLLLAACGSAVPLSTGGNVEGYEDLVAS